MANVMIASVCNLKCPYCFAQEQMQSSQVNDSPVFISLDTFAERLDFLRRSGITEIRLIGGEPTLHPHFCSLITLAHQHGGHLVIFSHGLMPERALAGLEALPAEDCTVLVNMNATRMADGPSVSEVTRREETLRRLGPRALLGFNIYQTRFDLAPLFTAITRFGCHKSIRLGLAQPVLEGRNTYLHPKQYPLVGRKIAEFAATAAEAGVKLEFDCGFVRCMFSEDDLTLLRDAGTDLGWRCGPVLDINISGQGVHCFPLSGKTSLSLNGQTASELRDTLSQKMNPYRAAGIYKECSTCLYKQSGDCSGGCLASTLQRFRPAHIRMTMPAASTREVPKIPE